MVKIGQPEAYARAAEKMIRAGKSQLAIRHFTDALKRVAQSQSAVIAEADITPLSIVPRLSDVDIPADESHDAISRTAILKLNGGLATSIGAPRAKALLEVADGQSFLAAIVKQVRYTRNLLGVELPLIFMNSAGTNEATTRHVPSYMAVAGIDMFTVQNSAPKLEVNTLQPVHWPANPDLEWAPLGHGDFYATIHESGVLDQLIAQGFRFLAVSNLDNLGASPSAEIAGWFARSGAPMAMEVSRRTARDLKGGHIALRKSDGRIILRERAQTAESDSDFFADEHRHRFFNTNNVWFDLLALRKKLKATGGLMELSPILNRRHVDPTDPSSPEVFQVESAIGSAIACFDGAEVLEVPRERFVPIKTGSDLESFRRDLSLSANGLIHRRSSEHAEPVHRRLQSKTTSWSHFGRRQ